MEIRKIGIVGVGPSGAGIAQVCVQSGLEALLLDEREQALDWAETLVLRGLERAEQPAAFSLLRKTTDFRTLKDCDLIIESAAGGLNVKKAVLRRIEAQAGPDAVLATDTAFLPVALLASAVENPRRLIGLHFFPPVPIMGLVELIRAGQSSEEAFQAARRLVARLGKTPVCSKDSPGFIVNRVSRPFFLTTMRFLEQGRGMPAQLDGMLRGSGFVRAGALELADAIGLEEDFMISAGIHDLLGRPERLRPSAAQEKLLARGCRGRKNSRGFYVYGENPPGTTNALLEELIMRLGQNPIGSSEFCRHVFEAVVAEAGMALEEGIASVQEINTAMRLAMHWPQGPFEWERPLIKP